MIELMPKEFLAELSLFGHIYLRWTEILQYGTKICDGKIRQ